MRGPIRQRGSGRRAAGFVLAILGLSALSVACESPIRVSTDIDPGASFATHETFAWISAEPLIQQVKGAIEGPPLSPIDDTRIRAAVSTELSLKGWRELEDPGEADLIVSYGLGTKERTEIYETPSGGAWHRRGYGYGAWYGGSGVRTRQVTEGTITLEFFDRRTKQAAWVGWASKRIPRNGVKNRDEEITTAVQLILETFPAKSPSNP